jgi:hypothetical protein
MRRAIALLSLLALQSPVDAQTRVPGNLRYRFGSVGLVRGQSLQVTIVNLTEPPEPDEPPDPAINPCWRVLLLDSEGRQIADSGDIELPPGRTRTFTIARAALGRSGDERTGRLQVRAVVIVENDNPLQEPPEPDKVRLTVEVLANGTGRTVFGILEPPDPERIQ